MTITSPHQADEVWMDLFNKGDLDGLLDLYEKDALLVPEPGGTALVGPEAIREWMTGFPLRDPQIDLRTHAVHERDAEAILYSDWTITGTGDDGPARMDGQAVVLLRKQTDGTWLLAFDDPFAQR
ncbi:YybH family protein [Actinomycetospora lemnae]|uniref:SgcJ/EcaC family oxidoreductase n=1 Tax=Actinomycetospora lemnae TaxID=3019891 RepID=A0ABT5T3X4_9PSEU|nr:SgcJ/EcaC family oxidoreductase [Actinomycetospora sp. DW7H6]MDD7969061.1 SgcJ/EcaC family oxidoreductase [Actinomycetospora sp. DW7H6]